MRDAARLEAAIELIDGIIAAALAGGAPADRIIAEYFRARRYAGSKDRRAIRELCFRAIRACGPVPESGRAAMLRYAENAPDILPLFDGSPYGPARIKPDEPVAAGGVAAPWLMERLAASEIHGAEAEALIGRAPLDIRVNTLKAEGRALTLPEPGEALPIPGARRFPAGTAVEQWEAYKQGLIEVQDYGSQLAAMAVGAKPGDKVIDLCAGAGGKTLALAAMMENKGSLIATDIDRKRLSRLAPRAERAGVRIAQTVLLNPGAELAGLSPWQAQADHVLVDAPCSGSGTWRRKPEARWRLNPQALRRFAAQQAHLLAVGAQLVRPGGQLSYVVCSLFDEEGAGLIAAFLSENPKWRAVQPQLSQGRARGAGLRLTPYHDRCDGFFVATLFAP